MFELMIVKVSRTRAGRKRIKERLAAQKCVACECSTKEAKSIVGRGNRGRCPTCKSRHERAIARISLAKRQAFWDALVRDGYLLEAQEIRDIKKTTVLSRLTRKAIGTALQ